MVKSKNIIAGLGVVAGLGMALLPLGAFAQNGGVETTNNPARTIRGVVGDVISIQLLQDNKEKTDAKGNKISVVDLVPGELNASLIHQVKVTTNAQGGYDLKMAAKDGKNALRYVTEWDPTDPTGDQVKASKTLSDEVTIASIDPTDTTGVALANKTDDSAGQWGYRIADGAKTETTDFSGNYLGIPTSASTIKTRQAPTVGAGATTGEYNDTFSINYGIVPAKSQLSGAYEATIVYSAVTNALGSN
ncbi:hypothetical protein IKF74_01380 [Candidatus Saccharibacteria bacterium]|nr:hypothetical protein [Candidatus Saccharibacteria bacterium]